MKNIFLFGWFGENNVGDDALLKQVLKEIRKINKNTSITVYTNNEDNLSQKIIDKNIHFENKKKLSKAILKYDIYIFGPGGLFPNKDFKKIVFIYIYVLLLKILRKHVLFLGLGIEECNFKNRISRFFINETMRLADECTLRYDNKLYKDQLSLSNKCTVSSDFMFLKEYNEKPKKKKYIAIALANIFENDEKKETFINSMSKFINKLTDDGYAIHFLSFTDKKDNILNQKIIDRVKHKEKCTNIEFTDDLDKVLEEINNSYMVLGMRFHSLVFATNLTVPFISLSYSSKNEELLHDLQLEKLSIRICFTDNKYFCDYIPLDEDAICEKWDYINNNYSDICEKLQKKKVVMRNKSKIHTDKLKKYLQ